MNVSISGNETLTFVSGASASASPSVSSVSGLLLIKKQRQRKGREGKRAAGGRELHICELSHTRLTS